MFANAEAIKSACDALVTYGGFKQKDVSAASEIVCAEMWEAEEKIVLSHPDVILLDTFGVDHDVLVAMKMYLECDWNVASASNDPIAGVIDNLWSCIIENKFPQQSMDLSSVYNYSYQAIGEVTAIWDIKSPDRARKQEQQWHDIYKNAIRMPSTIPYLTVGIRDINLIENAIAEGIDPHLLSTLTNI